jgi:hypothetical protein
LDRGYFEEVVTERKNAARFSSLTVMDSDLVSARSPGSGNGSLGHKVGVAWDCESAVRILSNGVIRIQIETLWAKTV